MTGAGARHVMLSALRYYWWIARGVGLDNIPRRLRHVWDVRRGRLRRRTEPTRYADRAYRRDCPQPAGSQSHWLERRRRFFAAPRSEVLAPVADDDLWRSHVTDVCEAALGGRYPMFSRWTAELGWPPDFNLDPRTGERWPTDCHWLEIPHDQPGRDVKLIWEPSRFSLAYYLARAYARSGEGRWARAFWEMFDAWVEQNPSQRSAAWGCGQETAFRLMAMLTGAMSTLDSEAATDDRLEALTRLVWQFARRIEANLNYARSQKNNHALSEALGLWTVGLLFPQLVSAARWRQRGARVLAAEAKRQIYDDGSFVQHSLNYHRVMLDDLMWAIRLGDLHDQPLPPAVRDRFGRAVRWLGDMIDPISGGGPNYGANDGANVLPLACCDYLDYRPTLQAGWLIAFGKRCLPPGPWDEKAAWLIGADFMAKPEADIPRSSMHIAPDGGYYLLRGRRTWAMTRCCTYRDRPSQADLLHVDLWCDGRNILRDAGSFRYNCPQPWKHYFYSTAAHNTVTIDGQDQMIKGPRFLWLRWPRATVQTCETSDDGATGRIVMQHEGYERLPGGVMHQRTIARIGDLYLVTDRLRGSGEHEAALRWRLLPGDWQPIDGSSTWQLQHDSVDWLMHIAPSDGVTTELVTGREGDHPEGWESLHYGQRTPTPMLIARAEFTNVLQLATLAGPAEAVRSFNLPQDGQSLTGDVLADRVSALVDQLRGGFTP